MDPLPSGYRNRIVCGDALEVMRGLPAGCIDLVATSPPYNIAKSVAKSNMWRNAALAEGYDGYEDDLAPDQYISWQRECLTEMMRLIPDTGAIFYNHKWNIRKGILQNRTEIMAGFPVRQIIIWWRKSSMAFHRTFFMPTYEVIYLIAKPKFRLADKANVQGDVWSIGYARNNPHPAPFPAELAEKIIGSTDAETVLDPFMGSGTTAVAAVNLGRTYVGIEQSEKYCADARTRIERSVQS